MKKLKFQIFAIFLFSILLFNGLTLGSTSGKNLIENDNFYFVHITDTHIMSKFFDHNEISKKRLREVLDLVCSYENKPAFIVATGDLVEWGGSKISGALNYLEFVSCFYKKDGQLYADADFSIPVYTTPGNHDYCLNRNLKNYHTYVDKNHIEDEDRYVVTYGDTSLFFMDSGPNYYSDISILFDWHGEGLCDCDIAWLEDELDNCQSANKIILMHHPAVGNEDDLFINNREEFVDLCETYDVEVVLAGHTHHSRVYDHDLNEYSGLPLNCSQLPTLYVQTDDCKQGAYYRNVSIFSNNIWLEVCVEVTNSGFDINSNMPAIELF